MNTDYADSAQDFCDAIDMAVNFRRGVLTYKQAADELRRVAEELEKERD